MTKAFLKQFCCPDDNMSYNGSLRNPWLREGFTWATDRSICLRINGRVDDAPENADAPSTDNMFAGDYHATGDWKPFAQIVIGVPARACPECLGKQKHACQCGHVHDCGECNGTGQVKSFGDMIIGERKLAGKYLQLISLLDGLEVNLSGKPNVPMSLRFNGGIGLVMPKRKD